MSKKKDTRVDKVLLFFAVFSLLFAVVEGFLYYDEVSYPDPILRGMFIVQNAIRAFGFKADIGLKDITQIIAESQNLTEKLLGYAYAGSIFIAPYCTLKYVYNIFEKWLRLKNWKWFTWKKKHVIILGYNDDVKSMVFHTEENVDRKKKYRIHLVAAEISAEEERKLLKEGIVVHKIDCLSLEEKQQKYFFRQMELKRAETIILFEQSSARNFSLYYMFCNLKNNIATIKDGVKLYCRCEDASIKKVIEDYHSQQLKATDNAAPNIKKIDTELVSLYELRVAKMFEVNSLHNYYIKQQETDGDKWNLHLLIVGFGKLGQQILLQAMNMGVVTSKNAIIVDVIDFDSDKQEFFANNFNEDYVEMQGNEYIIKPGYADGIFKIRFHKIDVRFKNFSELLRINSNPEMNADKTGMYTYIAICLKDEDIALHAMNVIENYLNKYLKISENPDNNHIESVNIGIRIEADKPMSVYLNMDRNTHKNVFTIDENTDALTLEDLLREDLDEYAKAFHKAYQKLSIGFGKDGDNATAEKQWNELSLHDRDSNRALARHHSVKKTVWNSTIESGFERFKSACIVNADKKEHWEISLSEKEFENWLRDENEYNDVIEMLKTEHRRWCYFKASHGWKCTDEFAKKNEAFKENPCMCSWEKLLEFNPHTCHYDLIPWIHLYQNKDRNG